GRLLAFAMVFGASSLLLVSLAFAAALASFEQRLRALPGGARLWQLFTFAFSVSAAAFLFALCFRIVPDVKLRFRDVWSGAVISALLFALGELALGFYIANFHASHHGAAGAVIVILIWVYYSAQILFYGAELTKARALRRGTLICPSEHAVYTSRLAAGSGASQGASRQ
ncbi:MAG TPA: YihY/virulence factor BrkB family protein, partial [Polyangiaceae bacterium]|nr:YihY/virulence factor BrkB family protein [Polyangiaceae bacterium]